MGRIFHFCGAGLGGLLCTRVPLPSRHLGKVLACLSVLGFGFLCYLFGAAVVFFQLPSYDFLHKAFTGAEAWHERGKPGLNPFNPPDTEGGDGIPVDNPSLTCDGFTLVTTAQGARATLLDMRG